MRPQFFSKQNNPEAPLAEPVGTNKEKPADAKGTPDDPNNPGPDKKDEKAKVLQTGGNKIDKRTANRLNEHFDQDLSRREWGKALEELKKENGLSNDFHGRIISNAMFRPRAQ